MFKTFSLPSVQFSSVSQSRPTLCDPMDYSTSGLPVHHQLPESTQTHVHLSQWCHPLISCSVVPFSSCLQSFPASRSFQMSQVAKVSGFQLQHQSFQWIFRTDFFRMDWLDLLAVQGTLKTLFQHHGSKASILRCSAFLTVQVSHPYMTTGKIIPLTRQTFVGKVMSLLLNMLSRLVITFLLRSKHLLISWLQSISCQRLKKTPKEDLSNSFSASSLLSGILSHKF